jgi:hypothetical protein
MKEIHCSPNRTLFAVTSLDNNRSTETALVVSQQVMPFICSSKTINITIFCRSELTSKNMPQEIGYERDQDGQQSQLKTTATTVIENKQ